MTVARGEGADIETLLFHYAFKKAVERHEVTTAIGDFSKLSDDELLAQFEETVMRLRAQQRVEDENALLAFPSASTTADPRRLRQVRLLVRDGRLVRPEDIAQMHAALTVAAIAGLIGLWFVGLSLVVTFYVVAYRRIRRRGYFPPAATAFVLGIALIAFLVTYGTAMILPTPNGDSWLLLIAICITLACSSSAAALAVVVRTLPQRNVRIFGRRRVRFPFVVLGYLVIAVAIAGGVAVSWLADNATVDNYLRLFVVVVVFAGGGIGMILTGRRLHNQLSIEEATRQDVRAPVLFLRPFAAESTPFVQGPNSRYGQYASELQQWAITLGTLHDKDGNSPNEDPTVFIPFERYLAATFRERIGPFIALGNPEDYLPPEGAIRTYAADEGWYEYFERVACQCTCLVMPVSSSANLERELAFLRREGLQRRLFIITSLIPAPHARISLIIRPAVLAFAWILRRLFGSSGGPQDRVISGSSNWRPFAEDLKQLGYDLGEDPGLGAVVTFNAQGETTVLISGAQEPLEFVEPIREYLTRTFGSEVVEVASVTSSATQLKSESGAPKPGHGGFTTDTSHSDVSTSRLNPAPTVTSERTPPKSRFARFLETKYAGWMVLVLVFGLPVALTGFHVWQRHTAHSLYDEGRYQEAAHYFQREAADGDKESMTYLGYMYERGLGVATSQEKAAELYMMAVRDDDEDHKPNSQAMVNLALMFLDGRGGLTKDETRALELCRRAANADNANAMSLLGAMYEDGLGGLSKDSTAALDWYRKASERGNESAKKRLDELQNRSSEQKRK